MAGKGKAGAKGKYDDLTVNRICRSLERTGHDQTAAKAGGISTHTFYAWLREKPQFAQRVEAARGKWADIDDEAITEAFRQGLIRAMTGFQQVRTNAETTTLPNGEQVKKVSKSTSTVPPAQWAFVLAAPQMAGKFGLERKDLTTGGKAIDFGSLTKEQLARIVAGERPEDV